MCQDMTGPTSILSDIEILARLVAKEGARIFVSPLIDPRRQLGPSSLDLRLGFDLVGTRAPQVTHIDLGDDHARQKLRGLKPRYFDKQFVHPGAGFVLHPGPSFLRPRWNSFGCRGILPGGLKGAARWVDWGCKYTLPRASSIQGSRARLPSN
jgi:hypothetical protein